MQLIVRVKLIKQHIFFLLDPTAQLLGKNKRIFFILNMNFTCSYAAWKSPQLLCRMYALCWKLTKRQHFEIERFRLILLFEMDRLWRYELSIHKTFNFHGLMA
jgi:hypothetical protein